MEKDLVRQCLSYHGPSLLSLLRCEQHEHGGFRQLLGELSKWPQYRKERTLDNIEIQQFIARKADLLFALSWKSNFRENAEAHESSEGCYAVMSPLEQFMEVSSGQKRELFFRDIERGDVVIGRIASIRDFGFFMVLIAMGSGILRAVEPLEISALCPLRDVPPQSNHGDPLSYYQIGDLIQAAVKDIDRYHEKITLSLHKSSLPSHLSHLKLGVISSEDMPEYYKHSTAFSSSNETYEKVLRQSVAFSNPSTVEFLLSTLGIDESKPPSLIRGLQRENFSEQDYAPSLRRKQSSSWALKCVKTGVDYFKLGRHVDAMNEYNKALEIDPKNVEALVARGALYATKGSLNKAIDDFEIALENCPTHKNARKYLCQTLVERGGQLEEEDKLLNAETYYNKALTIDKSFTEAEEALNKVRQCIQKSLEKREKLEEKEEQTKENKIETSAEKLRKLLKEEKRKKKRKRSSSSSSTSSESSSSSTSHKKYKKRSRSRKHSVSSSHSRKHLSVSIHEEQLTPPAHTSASFFKQDYRQICDKQDRPQKSLDFKTRNRSLSVSSLEFIDPAGGRSEDSRDSYSCAKTQPSVGKSKSACSASKYRSGRRDSSDSYNRRAEGRHRDDFEDCQKDLKKISSCKSSVRDDGTSERRVSGGGRSHEESLQGRANTSHNEAQNGNKDTSKTLPGNLLNILNQIAEFEKEKGVKQKCK
ncbi:tetratricopeptide repeat protein 14 isoform X1 [Hyla sarda]|uniref:tetratricopeptide repeat protein 14 isoform X1 n=1 Tax=Hyla sarda TaxID=327740 RepID=UPI0024C2B1E5|nr:tetratricopeptide repeat protein 14 isoform X1 [Hyla sarda]